jgi:hypothetical protein
VLMCARLCRIVCIDMVKFNLYARSANEVRQSFDGAGLVLALVLVSVGSNIATMKSIMGYSGLYRDMD